MPRTLAGTVAPRLVLVCECARGSVPPSLKPHPPALYKGCGHSACPTTGRCEVACCRGSCSCAEEVPKRRATWYMQVFAYVIGHEDVTCRPFMRTYGRWVANKLPRECPAAHSNRQFGVSYSLPFSCWRGVLGNSFACDLAEAVPVGPGWCSQSCSLLGWWFWARSQATQRPR